MSSNLKVNSLVPATGTEIGIGTTGGSIDFRCPATFGGNVTIGGTLTYDEVINIDSIGVITARSNIDCNGSLDVDGHTNLDNVSIAGVTTFSVSPVVPNGGYYKGIINSGSQQKIVGGYISGTDTLRLGESMYLTSTGLGIGIASPSNKLEISGGLVRCLGTASARFTANNGSAEGYFGWSSGVLTVGQAAATLSLEATGSNHIQLKTNGSERLRIKSNGAIVKGNSGTQVTVGNGANTQIIGSSGADASLALIRQASGGGEFLFAAGASGSNISSGNGLGFIKFMGYHTDGYDEYARIEAYADGTTGNGDAPGRIVFKTTADGANSGTERLRINSDGAIHINDGSATAARFSIGNGGDLKIFHTNPTTFIQDSSTALVINAARLDINNAADNEQMARFNQDGAVELYHNNIKKFDTITTGIRVHGDEGGTAQLQLLADEGDDNSDYWRFISETNGVLNIQDYGSGNWYNNIRLTGNTGGVTLFHNNATRLETTSTGIDISGTTDGVINLNTTDSRGSFIRYQQGGTTKVWVGSGQGLSLGNVNDLGLRATNDIRMQTGTKMSAVLTNDGYFAAKGLAGSWVDNTDPENSQFHQFTQTGVSKWVAQFQTEHHAGFGVQILGNSTANSEAFVVYSKSNNSTRFRVLWNGNCANANNSFGSLSDISIKENIVDANSQWDDIKAIKVRNFNLKNDPDTKMLGVVAQEVETVSPKLVWEDREGLKGVSYSVLYMKAIKALQESMTRIETLEAKVAALEGS